MWVLVMLAACGRVAFDARPDAAGAGGSTSCASWSPFTPPVELTGGLHSAGDDWYPTPMPDELELYFYSFRAGTLMAAIMRATRPTLTEPFGVAEIVASVDSPRFDGDPTITDDGLVLMFDRGDTGTLTDIVEARRLQRTDPFDIGSAVPVITTASHDESPFLDGAGLRLVFDRMDGNLALFETSRPSRDEPFATPRKLSEIDAPELDGSPTLSADGLELFFVSTRPGGPGLKDVWTATRTTLDDPFGAARPVLEVSSARDEYGLRLSRDGRTLYLNYDTLTAGGADAQMFAATRTCL